MLKTIIVDDDPIVNFLQSKIVSKTGLDEEPTVFKEPQEALDFLKMNLREDASVHYLVMLDINMPAMSGWEFLDLLKEIPNNEQCHVVMVTSSIDRKDKRNAANDSHVVDFIEKPVSAKHCNKLKGISTLSVYFEEN
ncbi:response regulator [Gramella jeungdoensis]|uniref:Response regulator n=1 Tax=Gramella jeungdoensis TaxID=708091 RepID=A0ABT0Z5M8_9FLAO|nr:response regulator [Gramella jeungdoensis]MCM8570462.1 response regulator [Gramella jeungdoensis]